VAGVAIWDAGEVVLFMPMEKPPGAPRKDASVAYADTQAIPVNLLADVTADEMGQPSSRRARSSAYASVSGEQGNREIIAEAPRVTGATDTARYEAGPLLGQGGMGEVVLNLDHVIGRHVARKTLLPEVRSDRTFTRFVREARVQGQLEHPSVVPVYDFGVEPDGAPFFTMKRVRGETLARVLEALSDRDADYASRFSRHKLLAVFRQVCLAVEYAHLRGVVHRDLKPNNIMLGDFGEVYVLDWGLAKLKSDADVVDRPTGADADEDRTGANDVVGTPAYMAPEQFGAGRHAFDTRQDVFALGAILFEILTLTRYRPGASFATLLPTLIREADLDTPTRPSSRAIDIAPELDETCTRALAATPAARLESAGAIATVIEQYLEGDHNQGVRRAMAATLLASARKLVENGREDASVRVEAMRNAIKALALTPDDVETQCLLLSLVVDGSGKLPPEVEEEFEANDFELDAHRARLGIAGLGAWFIALPFALWVGIRDWVSVGVMIGLTLGAMAYMTALLRTRSRGSGHVLAIAAILGATLALTSAWLGPFVLVPVGTCGIAILFGSRATPKERPWLILIWALAVLVPFGVELLHVFPPAYTFEGGNLVLHPRVLNLPEGMTMLALAYTALTFQLLPMLFLGQLRDKQRDGDRRMFVQAWHLRQLFPAASER
jgi:serine/threonine protein kinase